LTCLSGSTFETSPTENIHTSQLHFLELSDSFHLLAPSKATVILTAASPISKRPLIDWLTGAEKAFKLNSFVLNQVEGSKFAILKKL
jgi:hypothetical protein